ncbi:response regulator [Hahella sp. HN01]|uniref:response regulator n=1 Tax=Hahella sp. HN01 TaxID=2847262 RepID=UPI001C1ED582|nr:response regulator [Hahella sp. HN01]MBU6954809.1 response regulator [Hahella sp. HN01]
MQNAQTMELSWWRRVSIRAKMQIGVLGFALLLLLICAITLTVMANLYFHQKMRQDLQMLSKVLAENSGAALTFNDATSAGKVLSALKENASVEAAALYQNGEAKAFAEYPQHGAAVGLAAMAGKDGVWLRQEFYVTSTPVKVNEETVGYLVLKSNLQEWDRFKQKLLSLFLVLIGGMLALTLLVSYWLKSHITQPLASLSEWAMQVSKHKDFNARASKRNEDEIGHLVDSLNVMLSELARQETIVSLNRELEWEIQERKVVEKDLIATRNRAEEANKAKSRFLANMSHELRTPLNAIIGYSEMLQEVVAEDDYEREEILDDIGKVRSAGKHLLSLINDILDISKIEAGKMQISIEAFSMEDLVDEVAGALRLLADERRNKLVVRGAGEVGVVHSDLVKVRQILFNLLSNAVKFTQDGVVELICERESADGEDWMLCRVRDTGIGISASAIKELFRPFSQADPSTTRRYGGTGLGLAISRSYATMLGGEISVTSKEGEGSEFCIRLPTTAEIHGPEERIVGGETVASKPPLAASDTPTPASNAMTGARLLLIDDDPTVHDILKHQLNKHGFLVSSAHSGAEGLTLAKQEEFDVIVLDIFMPGQDGWQVLQMLKSDAATAHIPVVMHTIESNAQKGYALGASDFLVKPINGARLLSILQRYQKKDAGMKVLYVDDDVHSLELVRAYMHGTGWNLIMAEDGREGLEKLDQNPDVSMILLDLIMPEMNGFEFLEQIRRNEKTADTAVIVISARDLTQAERGLLRQQAQAVLRKGMYDKSALLSRIKEVLEERMPVS